MRLCEQFALLALPAATLAVSLSDFKSASDTMKESDLPPSCLAVYKANITGCSPSDFTQAGCSSGCIKALQSMTAKVESACGSDDLEGTGILTVFLNGNGPGAVCPGAAASADGDSTQSTDTTEATSSTSSTQIRTRSSSSLGTSSRTTSASSTASLSGTVTASSLAPTATEGGILVDTSSAAVPTASSRASHATSSINDHSGQGSPFDTQPILPGGAISMASFPLTTLLVTAVTVLHTML